MQIAKGNKMSLYNRMVYLRESIFGVWCDDNRYIDRFSHIQNTGTWCTGNIAYALYLSVPGTSNDACIWGNSFVFHPSLDWKNCIIFNTWWVLWFGKPSKWNKQKRMNTKFIQTQKSWTCSNNWQKIQILNTVKRNWQKNGTQKHVKTRNKTTNLQKKEHKECKKPAKTANLQIKRNTKNIKTRNKTQNLRFNTCPVLPNAAFVELHNLGRSFLGTPLYFYTLGRFLASIHIRRIRPLAQTPIRRNQQCGIWTNPIWY